MISHATTALLAGAVFLSFFPAGRGQTLTERELGKITLQGAKRGQVISPGGNQYANREEIDGKFRYVTFQGAGESFDRIHTKGLWIEDRLVYLAAKNGKHILVDGVKKVELKGMPTSPSLLPMLWPSPDALSYCVFASDGNKVRWYLNGKLQPSTFSRMVHVPDMTQGQSTPLFAVANGCTQRVVGHEVAGKVGWDTIQSVHSSTTGSAVYVCGERGGKPRVYRNDQEILREKAESFAISHDGEIWVAVVSRPTDEAQRTVVLQNGNEVMESTSDPMSQKLHLARDGSTWVWSLLAENQASVILKQPGKEDRKLEPGPQEFNLSDDGKREAYVQAQGNEVFFTIDGQQQPTRPVIVRNTFRFGPGTAFAYTAQDGSGEFTVISHLGEGPKFEALSPIQFLPDGRPVYTGDRGEENFIVVGAQEHPVPADELYGAQTLQVKPGAVVVTGTRGESVIEFTLTP